ncbi:uncharacterized protein TRIVIDRAFT_221180 [Trichoderma virens Gv29-8]|uniref:Uncharacterized protein n=1 Tax=Hypocrea virens (strain Gv29-8 / FGSC 10586) TaxID=413071 RepID=G9MPY3_HYPVG|nr:uncharacterized protein TRIVIDRAFT_221180 [Trichoderma virens Gv29-8]EHK23932.1 hypothetical protein TRIVIDRAFT_221180 [Trichoderma virens Gv29-8]UKZ50239.1 hypothetical protein TrVGV298_004495 [Trichoderma virens]
MVVPLSYGPPLSLVVGGQKRSRDDLDSSDVAEPASKRPALFTGRDDMSSQDFDMGNTNICPSPGNFCSSSPSNSHVLGPPSPSPRDADDYNSWGILRWVGVEEYTKESLCKERGGSYWYRMPSVLQGPPSPTTFNEKLIQDMNLFPDKTFFRISEMINARKNMYFGSRKSVFELFARVVHTGCGGFNFQTFQSFKLGDLYGATPNIGGIMMFKGKESPIYCESSPFLAATKTDDKCYCLCEVVEDGMAALGWSLYIYDIQPVTWEIIQSADAILSNRV